MIRQDPDRPGVYIVDVSEELVAELESEWSRPVQHRIEDGELVMRALIPIDVVDERMPRAEDVSKVYRIPPSRGSAPTAS